MASVLSDMYVHLHVGQLKRMGYTDILSFTIGRAAPPFSCLTLEQLLMQENWPFGTRGSCNKDKDRAKAAASH